MLVIVSNGPHLAKKSGRLSPIGVILGLCWGYTRVISGLY